MLKAQASSEYLILVGFVVGITIPLLLVYFTFTNNVNDQLLASQVDQIAKSIIDAADTVYFLGEPSQTTLKVYIPPNVNAGIISNKAIIYKIKTKAGISDITYVSSATLTGTLPTSSGIHFITLKVKPTGVEITYK